MCCIKAKGVKEGFSEEGISELNLKGGKGFPSERGWKRGVCAKVWRQDPSQSAGKKRVTCNGSLLSHHPHITNDESDDFNFLMTQFRLTDPTGGFTSHHRVTPVCEITSLYRLHCSWGLLLWWICGLVDGSSTGKDALTLGLPLGKPKDTEFQVSRRLSSCYVPHPGSQQRPGAPVAGKEEPRTWAFPGEVLMAIAEAQDGKFNLVITL